MLRKRERSVARWLEVLILLLIEPPDAMPAAVSSEPFWNLLRTPRLYAQHLMLRLLLLRQEHEQQGGNLMTLSFYATLPPLPPLPPLLPLPVLLPLPPLRPQGVNLAG